MQCGISKGPSFPGYLHLTSLHAHPPPPSNIRSYLCALVLCAAGAREYAADGVNALLVNATDIQQAIARAEKLMDGEYDLAAMRDAALEAAARFAMHRTRASSAETFKAFQIRWLQSERGYQLIGHSQSMSALRGR